MAFLGWLPFHPFHRQRNRHRGAAPAAPGFRRIAGIPLSSLLLVLPIAAATDRAAGASAQRPRLSDAVAEAGKPPAAQQPIFVSKASEPPVADECRAEDVETVFDLTYAFLELASAAWRLTSDTTEVDTSVATADGAIGGPLRPTAYFTLKAGAARLGGHELDGMATRSIGLGIGTMGKARLKLGLYFAGADLADAPRVADGIRSASELGADAALLVDLAPAHAAVGAQILMGARLGRFQWKYRNPVETIDVDFLESAFLYDDRTLAVSPYAGFGLEVLRTRRTHLTVTAIVGARTYGSSTEEGFANDFFTTANFAELGIEVGFFPEAR